MAAATVRVTVWRAWTFFPFLGSMVSPHLRKERGLASTSAERAGAAQEGHCLQVLGLSVFGERKNCVHFIFRI